MSDNSTSLTDALAPADECLGVVGESDYDMPLHIASVFVIMVFSFLGTIVPILLGRYFSTTSYIFQFSKLFGAGVIMSTALIHMITPAFEMLTNPCLPSVFAEYPTFATLFAMIGIFMTHLVQVSANQLMTSMIHKVSKGKLKGSPSTASIIAEPDHAAPFGKVKPDTETTECESPASPIVEHGVIECHPDDHSHIIGVEEHGHNHSHGGAILHSNSLNAYLLELGIASHSIIIGIALGVARDEFLSLFIALVFHQFFEGIALSAVVIEAQMKKTAVLMMVIFYSLTTPLGVAIGIAIHSSYVENATAVLVSQGTLDGLAGGILLYDGLVNIIVPHFNTKGFLRSSALTQSAHYGFLYLGAGIMSLIGKWA